MKVDENGGKRIENWLKWMKVHIKGMKMVGSGWNGMKMDESWWKWMNSDESCWKWMKEYESGRKWVKMDESGWKGMKADEMDESVWKWIKMVWWKNANAWRFFPFKNIVSCSISLFFSFLFIQIFPNWSWCYISVFDGLVCIIFS